MRTAIAIIALASSPFAAINHAITASPSTLLCPFIDGLFYGKFSLETDISMNRSYILQFSGLYYNVDKTQIEDSWFSSGEDDTNAIRSERHQYTLTIGKRYLHQYLYLQPSLLIGYASYDTPTQPHKNFDGPFIAPMVYCGVRFEPGTVLDINIGFGVNIYGKRSYTINDYFIPDLNLLIGYGF